MAIWYRIKVERLKINGKEFQVTDDKYKRALVFYPNSEKLKCQSYELTLDYFTGEEIPKQSWLGLKYIKEKVEIKDYFDFDEVDIEILAPPEKNRDVKNLGTGAIAGALVAGPIGAAAGAWLGTKVKNVNLKVTIPKLNMIILGVVATGFIEAWKKKQQLNAFDDF